MEPCEPLAPWNRAKLVGMKVPLKPNETWAMHIQLQGAEYVMDLAMFNPSIDSFPQG